MRPLDASASSVDEFRGATLYSLEFFDFGEDIRIALPPPEQVTELSSELLDATGCERNSRPRRRLHRIGSGPSEREPAE